MISKKNLIISFVAFGFLLGTASTIAEDNVVDTGPLQGVSLSNMSRKNNRYEQITNDGRTVVFTVDAALQQFTDALLDTYEVPEGAVVVINSRTGRVLALSSRYSKSHELENDNVALNAQPPAASVFKIVTAAALLENSDVRLGTEICYHGGSGQLLEENLIDSKNLDKACGTLSFALGHSTNAIFAKLSDRHLTAAQLARYSERFAFNREIPFDVALPVSKADVPSERLERARASAGFWHSHLSPLHAAVMAQSIAQKGSMLRPYIVDSITGADGQIQYQAKPRFLWRTVKKETAEALISAMSQTVEKGTARKSFHDKRGVAVVSQSVAGKTGTLHGAKPFRAYSWFVGLAPVDDPEVSIAVMIANDPQWRIKSSWAAAQILKKYFEIKKEN